MGRLWRFFFIDVFDANCVILCACIHFNVGRANSFHFSIYPLGSLRVETSHSSHFVDGDTVNFYVHVTIVRKEGLLSRKDEAPSSDLIPETTAESHLHF